MYTLRNLSKIYHPEKNYLKLVEHIIESGSKEKSRNGYVYTHIGSAMRFELKNKTMPILTSKKMAWKSCLKELLWFISGETDNTILNNQEVKIWNGNGNREFLDSRGLYDNIEGDLGPIYGHQWRHFNAPYLDCDYDYSGLGIDQLSNIISCLKDNEHKNSRRLIMSAWNPSQIDQMSLPPCHVLSQFHVTEENKLTCTVYQRSADIGLGLPFNIASYGFLTHLIAHHCNLEAKELIHFVGNCHIYDDHVDALKDQLNVASKGEFYDFPTLDILENKENIDDYKFQDFKINNYKYNKKIKMNMRA
jgi:thymidylate synthase